MTPPVTRGTAISWTDETWNPVTGCSHVSDGCRFCYAEQLSLKRGWSLKPWTAANAAENVVLHPERLRKPLSWRDSRRVFVNSMSDLFHPLVPFDYVDRVFDVMEQTPRHTYQVLTKRPERMAEYTEGRYGPGHGLAPQPIPLSVIQGRPGYAPPHIWLGTSIEDSRVLGRLDHLARVRAPIRFVSAEPLIGSLVEGFASVPEGWDPTDALAHQLEAAGVRWVIVGGESGPGFRPMAMVWAREIRDACLRAGAAFFFKQDAAFRTETRPFLVEEDGSRWEWHQYPVGELADPVRVGR